MDPVRTEPKRTEDVPGTSNRTDVNQGTFNFQEVPIDPNKGDLDISLNVKAEKVEKIVADNPVARIV